MSSEASSSGAAKSSGSVSSSEASSSIGCDFTLYGGSWNPDFFGNPTTSIENLGPDSVWISGITPIPSGTLSSASPSLPCVLNAGEFLLYTITGTWGPGEFLGAVIHTDCGEFLHPFGSGGDFFGTLSPYP